MENLEVLKRKILSGDELNRVLAYWRFRGYRVVFTNGCFDLIHLGHIDYLSRAADCGHILMVGLNSDDSVRRLKGQGRPINNETARSMTLAALHCVDAVVIFGEDTPYELIRQVQPDVLIKGSDYKAHEVVGYDIVTQKGGVVKTIEFVDGYSTTLIEEKIRSGQGSYT